MAEFYIALALIALITAVGVFLFGRLLSKHPAKRLLGVWICLATSVAMFMLYALEGERNPFMLVGGLTAFLFGAVALIGATVKRSN
jgi:hypothetical protein